MDQQAAGTASGSSPSSASPSTARFSPCSSSFSAPSQKVEQAGNLPQRRARALPRCRPTCRCCSQSLAARRLGVRGTAVTLRRSCWTLPPRLPSVLNPGQALAAKVQAKVQAKLEMRRLRIPDQDSWTGIPGVQGSWSPPGEPLALRRPGETPGQSCVPERREVLAARTGGPSRPAARGGQPPELSGRKSSPPN